MHDARIGRNGTEILKRGLAPAQERVALLIALEFQQGVLTKGFLCAEVIHLDGVIDDQIDRYQRVGFFRIRAHLGKRVAHGSEIDHAGYASEILQNHARRAEIDFLRPGLGVPLSHILNVRALHRGGVFKTQQVFEQNLDGIRHARQVEAGFFQRGQSENLVVPCAHTEQRGGTKGVQAGHGCLLV